MAEPNMPEVSKSPDRLEHDQRRARRPPTSNHLRRSHDRIIGGVAGGIANYINAEPTAVRWVFGIATILSSGVFLIAYALLWLLLPAAPAE